VRGRTIVHYMCAPGGPSFNSAPKFGKSDMVRVVLGVNSRDVAKLGGSSKSDTGLYSTACSPSEVVLVWGVSSGGVRQPPGLRVSGM
jgi:hypothetical protein